MPEINNPVGKVKRRSLEHFPGVQWLGEVDDGDYLITTTQAEAYADARVAESQRWISVDERLPDVGVPVLVYIPPGPDCHPSDVNIRFDFICPDYEYWHNHSEHYEHYCCVAKGGSGIEWSGPSEKAPYTHWMPLPAPPLPGPVEPTT